MQKAVPASATLKTWTVNFCMLCQGMVSSGKVLGYRSLRERRDAKVRRGGWGRAGGCETGQLQRSNSSVEQSATASAEMPSAQP